MTRHPSARSTRFTVFHHLPKTGGHTAAAVFRRWFRLVRDYADPQRPNDFVHNPIDLESLGAGDMLCGHFCTTGTHLRERFPGLLDDPSIRLVTFLRDPLDAMVSLFHFEKKVGHTDPSRSLRDFCESKGHNLFASYFPCSEKNYRRVLDRYTFVGLTDQMQSSVDLLASQLGTSPIQVPWLNPRELPRVAVSSDLESWFRERNRLDHLIYEYAKARFAAMSSPYRMTLPALRGSRRGGAQ